MSSYNKEYIAEICNYIFDDNISANEVNDQVADVAAKAFHAALAASKALDLVPRPAGFRPRVFWLMRQAVMSFWRSQGRRRIYTIAKAVTKAKWRSTYEMAKMGL
jgi:hypothetical protein